MKFAFKKYLWLTLLLGMFYSANLKGQKINDFRTWTDFNFSGNLSEKLNASLSFSERFQNNITRMDRSVITGSVQYEVFTRLFIEGGFRYYLLNDTQEGWVSRYRLHTDIFYKFKFNEIRFRIRERLQYGFSDLNSLNDINYNIVTNRLKIDAASAISDSRFGLYGSFELFFPIAGENAFVPSNFRAEAGGSYAISSKSSMQFGYLLDREINSSDLLIFHILHVTLKYRVF